MSNNRNANDPALRSFVETAAESDFPIQNLPYGVFSDDTGKKRCGVAIGNQVLDLAVVEESGLLKDALPTSASVFNQETLNPFMAMGSETWSKVRNRISTLLDAESSELRDNAGLREKVLVPQNKVTMHMPIRVSEYTDFYSSKYHAYNVGCLFRGPDNALQPNWTHLPVAYHGRASSVVVSGTNFKRPKGQVRDPEDPNNSIFSPCRLLDYELEMGFVVGAGNRLGEPIPIEDTPKHIFGMVLLNDWSARDIQAWEYVPLGPFLSKNFCTSISPWIVTLDALQPFRVANQEQDPEPLPYLRSPKDWGLNVELEVELLTAEGEKMILGKSNLRHLYWNICQQLAHHTVSGCEVNPGDLMGSGTISGPTQDSLGCLLEITKRGQNPVVLPSGATRKFLLDHDTITLRGHCQGKGYRVGFGSVQGTVLPTAE